MSTISVLNQIIDDDEGVYRIRFGEKVRYLTISTKVFDDDTMCRPYLLIPSLPDLPEGEWTRIKIARASESPGAFEITATNDPLPEIETVWHPQRIDVLSLEETKYFVSNVREVLYNGVPAISKIAAFDWEMPRLERESWAYSVLDQYQHRHPELGNLKISPRVLGHLTESGRVIGLLLERLEGRSASVEDLPTCANTVRKLHEFGLTHGDVNRYNFIINDQNKLVSMVDFEHASAYDAEAAKTELESLVSELKEETGWGAPVIL